MDLQRTLPDHDGLSEKEHINFIEPHMCLQIALILIPRGLRYLAMTPTTIQDRGKTEASDSHRVAKTLTAFHW